MKKLQVLTISLLFLFSLVACGIRELENVNTNTEHPSVSANTPGAESGGDAANMGGNPGCALAFYSYAGPVFPLMVSGDAEGVTATREVVFNFASYGRNGANASYMRNTSIMINDNYVLTNDTLSDKTVKLLYPFNGSFSEYNNFLPVLTSDDQILNTELAAGPYSGGFTGFEGWADCRANLKPANSWEEYAELLSDGEYMRRALSDPDPLDQIVTVYEFSNTRADHIKSDAATLAVEFNMDFTKTKIMTYWFNGYETDDENNYARWSFFVPKEGFPNYDGSFYLIALGEDLTNLVVQGYKNGGCYKGDEVDHVSTDMKRYESTLGEILMRLISEYMTKLYDRMTRSETGSSAEDISLVMLYKATVELLLDYGTLSENAAFRYQSGMLDAVISEVLVMDRVFYLTCEIDIPAGESVGINAAAPKSASYDFYGSGPENAKLGYDVLTPFGSDLRFISMTARAEGLARMAMDIAAQNFGFSPDNGVFDVTLDLDEPHYFIEVRIR